MVLIFAFKNATFTNSLNAKYSSKYVIIMSSPVIPGDLTGKEGVTCSHMLVILFGFKYRVTEASNGFSYPVVISAYVLSIHIHSTTANVWLFFFKASSTLVEFITVTSVYVCTLTPVADASRLQALLLYIGYFCVFAYALRSKWRLLRPDSLWSSTAMSSTTETHLNDVCPICHDTMELSSLCVTPCGHVFHRTCLTLWLNVALNCPSCRHEF